MKRAVIVTLLVLTLAGICLGAVACYYDGAGYAPVYNLSDGDEEAEDETGENG